MFFSSKISDPFPQISPFLQASSSFTGLNNGTDILLHHYQDLVLSHHLVGNASFVGPETINLPVSNKLTFSDFQEIANQNAFIRKKSTVVKKDRHSKIFTSQGLRDRRVRLSISIARKFFDLQEMLGFDKPSKTIDWLLTNSKTAIEELQVKENQGGHGLVSASIIEDNGNGEILRTDPNRKSSMVDIARESRVRARARARERTREKLFKKFLNEAKKLSYFGPSNIQYQTRPWNPTEVAEKHIVESSVINRNLKPPSVFGFQENFTSKDLYSNCNSSPIAVENWDFST